MKRLIISLIMGVIVLSSVAQEKVYGKHEVELIYTGNGVYIYHETGKPNNLLDGEFRLLDDSDYTIFDIQTWNTPQKDPIFQRRQTSAGTQLQKWNTMSIGQH